MKTDTRTNIIKFVDNQGKARPIDLQRHLNLTPQTIHYHLRNLTKQGILEAKGSVPHTYYIIPGDPDFVSAAIWITAPSLSQNPEENVCETRDRLNARLPHLKTFINHGLSMEYLPLVISTTGEVGNNSFDHNLGQWRDVPGCWFEVQAAGKNLWILISDRGQGIYKSLARVHPQLSDDQAALKMAFETIISGRAPEQRGNGLKYVRNNILKIAGCGVACISGAGRVTYGEQGEKCLNLLNKYFTQVQGTTTLMVWRLK